MAALPETDHAMPKKKALAFDQHAVHWQQFHPA
jgi:hypothetical protein